MGHGRYKEEYEDMWDVDDDIDEWRECVFGPDVHWTGHDPATLADLGIFGFTHEELLESEWVQDDVLTIKCVLEVRPKYPHDNFTVGPSGVLPESSIVHDMNELFEKRINTDVRLMVRDEVIHAHSLVLCQRLAGHRKFTVGFRCGPVLFVA